MKIAPSLLSADFVNLEKEIELVQNAGANILHLDVMDGHFVPNLTFGLPIIRQIKKIAKIPLDVHLMVTNPEIYLEPLANLGIEYISIHQETVLHLHRQILLLKERGVKAGIALNPATPVATILPIISELDFVLLMSVNPGFGGQNFLPLVYNKIQKLREFTKIQNPSLEIEIDGGVNGENAKSLVKMGADILVAGSFVFGNSDYKKQIQKLNVQ
ncbi:MAG: ribulose-phosphate 3-epimerase [Candidatus Cloacimonetes bacterium]|nr:ribulose-phosphate 3-epimerase [Candidatus Cloacimonadota bacterium]MBT7470217.1 ribulose-phosphate 3-epimerase [Candidatus Cloacimonadota bacterium]